MSLLDCQGVLWAATGASVLGEVAGRGSYEKYEYWLMQQKLALECWLQKFSFILYLPALRVEGLVEKEGVLCVRVTLHHDALASLATDIHWLQRGGGGHRRRSRHQSRGCRLMLPQRLKELAPAGPWPGSGWMLDTFPPTQVSSNMNRAPGAGVTNTTSTNRRSASAPL
jgi:hypothetical protein